MNQIPENNILPPFFTESKYRIWRHLLFILTGAIIASNPVFINYQDCIDILGDRIYWICFSSFMLLFSAIYFNYYFLVPRFLLKEKYILYFAILSLIVFLLPIISIMEEYWIRNSFDLPHRISSYTNPLILVDNLASCMMFFICFLCVTLVQLFKYWKAGDEQANLLEYENLITEVHKIKGQITPAFLSKTLNNASLLVKTNPKKTTDMLLKTGHLLRYQLYDSNRNKVLLKSEINFLSNFLDLEKLNRDDFQYTIKTEGDLNNVFVIPMLFISIVQNIADKAALLHLSFAIDADILRFQCYSENGNNFSQEELSIIGKQFELLYPGSHALTLNAHAVELVINVSE